MTTILIFIGLIVVLALYIMSLYNALVTMKNAYLNAFAQIQVQLKRRYDLIPSLVETAKGYMKHEKETFEKIVEARNGAKKSLENAKPEDENGMRELEKSEANLSNQMSNFNVTLEAYPELKSNENMMQLSEELTTTENKISFARQAYNDAVMDYNNTRESLPTKFFAVNFGHPKNATLLQFEDSEAIQKTPEVKF